MGHRTRSRLTVASLITIAVLSVAGCGGDDDDEAPSKQEFIVKADAICQKADKEQAAVEGKAGPGKGILPGDNFSDPAFLSRYNAVTRDALKRLRALDAPEKDREAVDDVLSAIEGSIAAVDKQIAALRARNLPKQSENQRDLERSYGDIGASSGALGLTRCQGLGN